MLFPTMLVGNELFWGTDSFRHFENHLAGEDPIATTDLEAWDGVRPSAVRTQSR